MPTTVSSASELVSAVENAGSGEEIIAEPGTYSLGGKVACHTPNVTIRARNDAVGGDGSPVTHLQGSGSVSNGGLVDLRADGITFRGFEVSGSGFKGIELHGGANGIEVSHCDVHDCHVWGVMTNSGSDHVIRDCDSHDNRGNLGNADGFNGTGSRNVTFERCRAWNNGDDGFDMWTGTNHTLRHCWAWENGPAGNAGFKLGKDGGGGGHLVEYCVAHSNDYIGFSWNQSDNPITVRNCTAWNNAPDYRFEDASHRLENNISADNSTTLAGSVDQTNNTWGLGISNPGFVSTDPSSSDFLRLSSSSPCVGAGVEGGDLGAFTSGEQTSGSSGDSSSNRITIDGEATLGASGGEVSSSTLQTEHTGYNGEGYVNFVAADGASLRWPLEVASAGAYNFTIRFANGGSADRTAVMAAGDSQQDVTFPQTGGWVNWSTISGTIELPSGSTELVIETTGEDAGNVDQLTLQPADDSSSGGDGSQQTGDTPNHGYHIPEAGQSEWHVPINENFESIDRDVPVVDAEGSKGEYEAVEGSLFVAVDTGSIYVGDGSQWNHLGTLS